MSRSTCKSDRSICTQRRERLKHGVHSKISNWLIFTMNILKNGQLSLRWWMIAIKISVCIAIDGFRNLERIGRYGPLKRMRPSRNLWRKLARIGNYSQRCLEQRLGNRLGKGLSISLTQGSRRRIGLMSRIERSLNCIRSWVENGRRLASIFLADLKTR